MDSLRNVECKIDGTTYSGSTSTGSISSTTSSGRTISQRDSILMDRVCKIFINNRKSPLCNDWDTYFKFKKIIEDRKLSWSITLGIMYAESHIGANYAGTCNDSYNNWWWIKWRILDDWTAVKDQTIPQWWVDKNKDGKKSVDELCYLYRFKSLEDYMISKANTLAKYRSCLSREKPIECISYDYVWARNVAERSWIERVASIAY